MATNSGRGNPIGAEDGPAVSNTSKPPTLSADTKSSIFAQEHDSNSLKHGGLGSTGLHDAGQDKDAVLPAGKVGVESEEEVLGQGKGQGQGQDKTT